MFLFECEILLYEWKIIDNRDNYQTSIIIQSLSPMVSDKWSFIT